MQLPGSPDPATPVAEAQMLEQAVHDLGPRWRLRFWMIFSGQALSLVGSALVPLAAWLIFKEAFSWQMAFGYGLMLAGLVVVVSQSPA